MMLMKLGAVKKLRRGEAEEGDDRHLADDDRQDAEVARLDVVADPLPEPGVLLWRLSCGEADARRHDVGFGAHDATSDCGLGDARDLRRDTRGDRLDDFLLGRRVTLVDGDVATESEHGDSVGDLEDVVEVVRDEHDGQPSLREALDEVEHLARLGHAERGGRLVENDEARVPLHGLRHRN